jgi:hypothetical protein
LVGGSGERTATRVDSEDGDRHRLGRGQLPQPQFLLDRGYVHQLERQLGPGQLAALEAQLAILVEDSPIQIDAPGWVVQD